MKMFRKQKRTRTDEQQKFYFFKAEKILNLLKGSLRLLVIVLRLKSKKLQPLTAPTGWQRERCVLWLLARYLNEWLFDLFTTQTTQTHIFEAWARNCQVNSIIHLVKQLENDHNILIKWFSLFGKSSFSHYKTVWWFLLPTRSYILFLEMLTVDRKKRTGAICYFAKVRAKKI